MSLCPKDIETIQEALTRDIAMHLVGAEACASTFNEIVRNDAPHDETFLALMALFARAGNGHTRLIPNGAIRVYPLRLVWAGNHLWSVGSAPRIVTSINNCRPETLFQRLQPVLAGTPARQRVIGALPLAWPAALTRIGLSGETVTYRFEDGGAEAFSEHDLTEALPVYPISEQGFPVPGVDPYESLNPQHIRLPSFANQSVTRDLAALEAADLTLPLVLDLRGNAGGDFIVHLPILERLKARKVRASLLVDRFTFSAAIVFVALCKRWLGARIIGETMSDGERFFAEGGTLPLDGGAVIRFSDGSHDWRDGQPDSDTPPEIARHMIACGDLRPDKEIVTTPSDLLSGKDPALDRALEF